MVCCLSSSKPQSEPMLMYCELAPGEQTIVKFQPKSKRLFEGCVYQNVIFGDHLVQTSMCQNRTYCITWELVHSIMTLLGSNSYSSPPPCHCVKGHLWCLCINGMQLSPNEQVPVQSSLSWQPQLHPLLLLVSLLGTTEIHKPGKMELTTRRNSSEYRINRLHQWWT